MFGVIPWENKLHVFLPDLGATKTLFSDVCLDPETILNNICGQWIFLASFDSPYETDWLELLSPPRMPVTTRIAILVGNYHKPSFVTVIGWVRCTNLKVLLHWL